MRKIMITFYAKPSPDFGFDMNFLNDVLSVEVPVGEGCIKHPMEIVNNLFPVDTVRYLYAYTVED